MDIKRVVAYSTMVHVGLMLVGLGLAGIDARGGGSTEITDMGMEHLFNHGWSKGLLFMVVGVVLHSVLVQDMRGTGGMVVANGILGVGLVATWSVAGVGGSMIGMSKECVLGTLVMEFGWVGSVVALLVVGSIGYSIGVTMSMVGMGSNAWSTGGGLSVGVWVLLTYLGMLVVVLPLGAGYAVGEGRECGLELIEVMWLQDNGRAYRVDWLTLIFIGSVVISGYVGTSGGRLRGVTMISDSVRALYWNRFWLDRLVNAVSLWIYGKVMSRVVIDIEYGWVLNSWFSGWYALRMKGGVTMNVVGVSVGDGSSTGREGLVSGIAVLLLLEGIILGSYDGGMGLVWLVVCMDSVSMLICVLVYGKGVVVSRYLMLQGGLTCVLWLGLTSGIGTLVSICWMMKLGVGVGAFVLPSLYGRLGTWGVIIAGVVGMVQLWIGVSIGLVLTDVISMCAVIVSGAALSVWVMKGMVANVGVWRAYSLSVSTVVVGVTTWVLGEGLAGGVVLTGLWVWVAMVIVVGGG